ncbi:hypothetical protein F4677DRAFT_419024 [Hypoxylon crocopeplum]|nr:hypothetical protein F4677DRAFT_419024 [Hypoxylon crocopeplum]
MADLGERKREELSNLETEAGRAQSESVSESQQFDSTLRSGEAEVLRSILATLPPTQQWSSATIENLKSTVRDRHSGAEWHEQSDLTRGVINAILASNEGWNWQRLKTCSNGDYFSLPTQTIKILNALFHSNALDVVKARTEEGHYANPLDLYPAISGTIGYPIFRVDYSSDENFELFKRCWDEFLEREFYAPEAVDPDDVSWFWVDKKDKLDGKGPREIREEFQRLCATTFPHGLSSLWVCLMVDREAIESMLRVYGPPVIEVSRFIPLYAKRKEISFLPYITAVSTRWMEEAEDEKGSGEERKDQVQEKPLVNDREYHGHFKCALRSVFNLWQNEQLQSPEEYYPRVGNIWGDIGVAYETPSSLH